MSDGNEMTKFDPAAYVEAIKGKIKNAIVDEQWNAMIRLEIERLIQPSQPHKLPSYGYADPPKESEFSRIVKATFEEELRRHVKEHLASDGWKTQWDGLRMKANEALTRLLVENSGPIISGWLSSAFSSVIQSMQSRF